LKTLSDIEDINRAWENITENIKTSAKESWSTPIEATKTVV